MPHGHTRIASRGACIYCGARDVDLTDEHVVPFSLGGAHILEDASCRRCAAITTKFERDVAKDMWGDARISYNVPSRRKKKRKTHIVLAARMIEVYPRPKRAHQGWRYLEDKDAPRDLAAGESAGDVMPGKLAGELARLGLV